jgi:hypothetical protein
MTFTDAYSRVLLMFSACVAVAVVGTALLAVLPHQVTAQVTANKNEHSHQAKAGEMVYIPAYSHIVQGERAIRQPLSSTLVIHNVAPSASIEITSVRYYDHTGTKLKEYINDPRSLGPFASINFVVDIKEDHGGVGANFIVEWQAEEQVVSPIIEAIMSGGTGTQGLSFVTRGKVIATHP